jgi:alpha-glucosidase
VQMCYPFEFLAPTPLTAARAAETFARLAKAAPDAWPCWAFSNHDTIRHVTRWRLDEAATKLYAILLVCLRGSLCLYQGEELGLPESDVAFEDLQDPYGIQFWPEFKGRDGCRTPMVWTTDNANGGFSDAARTWLPIDAGHLKRSVATQDAHSSSVLHHYRRALGLRAAHSALTTGDLSDLRHDATQTMFCAFNIGGTPASVALPGGMWRSVGSAINGAAVNADRANLGAWQACLALRT